MATYLEVQDDCPDQAKGQLGVAISNVIISDVHQLYLRTNGSAKQPDIQGGGQVWGL